MNGFNDAQRQDLEEVGFTNDQILWFETTNINNDELYFDELYSNIMYEIFDNDKSPQQVYDEYIEANVEEPNQGGRKIRKSKKSRTRKTMKRKTRGKRKTMKRNTRKVRKTRGKRNTK